MRNYHYTSEDADRLRALPFFQGLDAAAQGALRGAARQQLLAADETLFQQGDEARAFYIVLEGGVRLIEHTAEGKDVNLKVYGPGDLFGLLAISGGFRQHAEIAAIMPTELVALDGQHTRGLMQQHPSIALKVIDTLVEHVHHAHSRIRQMAVEKTERRLARAILHFCDKFSQSQPGQPLAANFSQQDMAEFTGTTLETVNRLFRSWEQQGFIERRRMAIILLDMAALRRIADEPADSGMGYLVE